jgi:hypothetical protein
MKRHDDILSVLLLAAFVDSQKGIIPIQPPHNGSFCTGREHWGWELRQLNRSSSSDKNNGGADNH